jgi:GT2 family glycosyltransferase
VAPCRWRKLAPLSQFCVNVGAMADQSPVVAAIPNYNMAENLRKLLPQVLAQGYDGVFVLDDASTDDSADVVGQFGGRVEFVRSPRNVGPAANRNQIIDRVGDGTIIHFVDADMELVTTEIPTVARKVFAHYADRGVGMIGGLVTRLDGMQEPHNYGAVFSLWGGVGSGVPLMVYTLRERHRLAGAVQKLAAPVTKGWPKLLETPAAEPAYWVHEGNMLVDSTIFRAIGGYDPNLRSHEAQDLALRLEKIGVKRQFDPSIEVVHYHIDVRGKYRSQWTRDATGYLLRKHGVWRWLTDR